MVRRGLLLAVARALAVVAPLCAAVPLAAQQAGALPNAGAGFQLDQNAGPAASTVVVIDLDRFFIESAFGGRVARDFEARRTALVAENRKIEAELGAEERGLTEDRAGMAAADFRALADAFDEKVQRIRREQDAKVAALGQDNEAAQRLFLQAADPVLTELMQDIGASVLIERRYVLKRFDAVDITDLAIARVDEVIGTGASDEGAAPQASEPSAPPQTAPAAPANE